MYNLCPRLNLRALKLFKMDKIQIIKQLLNGNHLEPKELKEAQKIVQNLSLEIANRLK